MTEAGRVVSHNNPSKERGTRAEVAVVQALRDHGYPQAERRALAGKFDRGDVTGIPGVVVEVKDCQRMALAEWVDEAIRESTLIDARYGPGAEFETKELAVVWHKRRGRSNPLDWYVTMTGRDFLALLDAYVKEA